MRVSDFSYELPEELIAQFPPELRGTTRLLVLPRDNSMIDHRSYQDFSDYVEPGDVVVLNDTKVIRARLIAQNSTGKVRELLLLEDHHTLDAYRRRALYRGKLHAGEILTVGDTPITIEEVTPGGITTISSATPLLDLAERVGTVPLPPYMHREATRTDIERYQTVFAKHEGSVAAPTASLNFTEALQDKLTAKGATSAYLTLHVGLGTFLPIRTDDVKDHVMHSEYFEIPAETARQLHAARAAGRKIFAVGTTVARTLEYAADQLHSGGEQAISGEADIFIYPGYRFKMVDGLLTNFHAPKSTVLMLAAAFAGWDNLQRAYEEAIREKYAFLSYGDSMLIL
jgi:S-adenosylmethionine:tRNA ribosyltransferase-isomerase